MNIASEQVKKGFIPFICKVKDTDLKLALRLNLQSIRYLGELSEIEKLNFLNKKMLKRILISPNRIGYLYKNMKFIKILEPGVYWFFNPFTTINVRVVTLSKFTTIITNQLIKTKENLEIGISYFIEYKVNEPVKFMNNFDLFSINLQMDLNQDIHYKSQVLIRDIISTLPLDEILNKRSELSEKLKEKLTSIFENLGIEITSATLRDTTLKSDLKNIYSEEFLVEKKAKLALEKARSEVASARALANAAKILSDNENIKFLKTLETLEKISEKSGNNIHIHLGDKETN